MNLQVLLLLLHSKSAGLMDSPDSPVHLGGDAAAELYEDYLDYYIEQTSNPSV